MPRVSRVGCLTAVLVFAVHVTACGDSSNAAHCEPNASGNQQALQSLNAILTKDRENTDVLLARVQCIYFLGNYAQAVQDTSEVIRRKPK